MEAQVQANEKAESEGRVGAFELKAGLAEGPRLGRLMCAHGQVETPIFMPVGTQGTVKGLLPAQVAGVGGQILLGNTYHLNLRPGSERVRRLGGLHRFMGWDKPILTDSGGFQVYSLAKLRKLTDAGIEFRSHIDGARVTLTPQRVMEIQDDLGSDIAMVLDECPGADASEREVSVAVERSLRWAAQARSVFYGEGMAERGRLLFGIVQGGCYPQLRRHCAEALVEMDFPGYAVGGVSVGEAEQAMLEQVEWTTAVLPAHKPRYVMGVGTPVQLLRMIALGADMFDCVMPTREARHGIAYTDTGRINIKNSQHRDANTPLMERFTDRPEGCFSRAYLRHLFAAGEQLGGILLSLHNLRFYLDLMAQARAHIAEGDYFQWHLEWIAEWNSWGTRKEQD